MKFRKILLTLALCAMCVGQASALEYTYDAPEDYLFGRPTSQDAPYTQEDPNVDRSKNVALVPPGFGTPTSYLPGSGEALTPNLVPGVLKVGLVNQVGSVNYPAIGLSVKVYQGTDSKTLAKGAGHFTDTSIWDGNVCVAAHNRGVNAHFGKIHTLEPGDTVTLTTKLGTRSYAVTSVEKVSETDTSGTAATSDNRITLYTCVRDERDFRWKVTALEQ